MAGALSLGWLFAIAFGAPAVVVEGAGDCPSAAAVSAELSTIMTLPEIEGAGDRVVVAGTGSDVSVVLFGATGGVLGERRVSAEGSCEDKARAVAVILAAWLTDVHPEFRTSLPEAAPPVVPTPLPEPPPPPAPPPAEPAAPSAVPAEPATVRPPEDRPYHRFSFAVAGGLEVSTAGAAPALELSGRFAPARTGAGVFGFALAALPVGRELGAGTVRSFRWPLGVGPLFRLVPRDVVVDLALGPTLAWLHLAGDGFQTNESANDAVLGGFVAVGVTSTRGSVRPYAGVSALFWPGTTTAASSAPEAEVDLPPVEGTLLLGVLFAP